MPSFLNKFRQDEDGDMDASPPGEQEKPKVGLAQVTGGTGLDKMLGDWLTSKTAGAAGAAAAPAAGAAAGAGGAAGGLGGLGAMAGGAGGLGSVIPGLTMATMKGAGKAAHQANIPARAGDALADFGRKMQGLPSLNRPDPTDKYGMFGFGLGQALAGIGGGGPAVSGNVDKPGPAQALDLGGLAGAPKGGAAAALAAAGKPDDGPMGPPMPPGWTPGTPRGGGMARAPKRFQEAPTFSLEDSTSLFAPEADGTIARPDIQAALDASSERSNDLAGLMDKARMLRNVGGGVAGAGALGLLGSKLAPLLRGAAPAVAAAPKQLPPGPPPLPIGRQLPPGGSSIPTVPGSLVKPAMPGGGAGPMGLPPRPPPPGPPPIPPNAPLGPVGGAPGPQSPEAGLIAAAIRSGALKMRPGETMEQAIMRYVEMMGEGGTAAAARSTGASPQDLLRALMLRANKPSPSSAGTVPMR